MTQTIICFDLDGTLLDSSGSIHPRDIEILRNPAPACLIPTTGRPLHAVKRLFARHGLFSGAPLPFPLVLHNGALLYLPGEKLLAHLAFQSAERDGLVRLARERPRVTFLFLDLESVRVMWPRPFAERAAASYDFTVEPLGEGEPARMFSKLMCLSETPADLEEISRATEGMLVERAYSMTTILEFTPPGADKGKGLRALQAALGLQESPVYAAGDGGNDLPLFAAALRSFAPISSPTAVRAAASQLVDVRQAGLLTSILTAAGVNIL